MLHHNYGRRLLFDRPVVGCNYYSRLSRQDDPYSKHPVRLGGPLTGHDLLLKADESVKAATKSGSLTG